MLNSYKIIILAFPLWKACFNILEIIVLCVKLLAKIKHYFKKAKNIKHRNFSVLKMHGGQPKSERILFRKR